MVGLKTSQFHVHHCFLQELFALRARLETLAIAAVKAMTAALTSTSPQAIDETLEQYACYPPASMPIWRKLKERRRAMPVGTVSFRSQSMMHGQLAELLTRDCRRTGRTEQTSY
eukprot:SAG11_NODE_10701_length_811_cov_1.171348_2_plen_114_part_01